METGKILYAVCDRAWRPRQCEKCGEEPGLSDETGPNSFLFSAAGLIPNGFTESE